MPADSHRRQQQQIAVIKVEIPIQKPVKICLFGNLHCQKYLHDISHQHPCTAPAETSGGNCSGLHQSKSTNRRFPPKTGSQKESACDESIRLWV